MPAIDSNKIFRLEVKLPTSKDDKGKEVQNTEKVNIVLDYKFLENKPLVFAKKSEFPTTGNSINLYIATDEMKQYIWYGGQYCEFTVSLAEDSSKLNGQDPSYYLNWNNFTNLPDCIDGGDLDV